MTRNEQDLLWTETVNRGIESSGPNTGSLTFFVSVRRRFSDFLQTSSKCATMEEGRSEASAETGLCLIRIAFPEWDTWRLFSQTAVVTTAVNTLYGRINVLNC
ncbi:hypothetical protein V6N12_067599 [Hibiscus sabdariffa]|uniref:Uncharacterized protein n=1 Tax=Hibiscus sabdariffa TaxID=183260 RepID=A0ABR2B8Y1_9ROSI